MTDDEFKTYLYMMGTRGTAFWELYYSPEMIDEGQKWDINAEYLEWAKKNYHILKNAKLIGTTPDKGNTYGSPAGMVKKVLFPCEIQVHP